MRRPAASLASLKVYVMIVRWRGHRPQAVTPCKLRWSTPDNMAPRSWLTFGILNSTFNSAVPIARPEGVLA